MAIGRSVSSAILGTVLLQAACTWRAHAQSFNCQFAKTADEILICHDEQLAELDKRAAAIYSTERSKFSISQRSVLEGEQRSWLRSRKDCGSDKDCIVQAYDKRIRG